MAGVQVMPGSAWSCSRKRFEWYRDVVSELAIVSIQMEGVECWDKTTLHT